MAKDTSVRSASSDGHALEALNSPVEPLSVCCEREQHARGRESKLCKPVAPAAVIGRNRSQRFKQ